MSYKDIKKQADELIGQTAKVPLIDVSGRINLLELEVLKNKVLKSSVLTSFKDSSFVCNALIYLSKFPYEAVEEPHTTTAKLEK